MAGDVGEGGYIAAVAEVEHKEAPRRCSPAVEALRERIVQKVKENRVTHIVGDTECGKSPLVHQFLLAENMEPIMCTQPRRLAVVTIAQMVAEARKCQVGEDVGYHIGHSNVSNLNSTRSATTDITRYKEYFSDIGRRERVEVIAVPSSACTEVLHLEQVHILHRSIDTDEALQTMEVSKSVCKVILATNIAESSVTIPGVAYVIDSCRSLQVYWDPIRKTDSAGLVWVSKSQANQRKGRTGRTCDCQIYWSVTGPCYNSLCDHEYPAILRLRLSLREQVLMVCCAASISINDPTVLVQKVLDTPIYDVIDDSPESLVQIHALVKPTSPRGRPEPTFYGFLLNNLPLSFDAFGLTLQFGEIGYLHGGILVGIMMDMQPLRILQPFGYHASCKMFRDNYFEEGSHPLCAFQFWQHMFKDAYHLECLKNVANTQEPKAYHKPEEVWCASHNLVLAALNNISEMYDDIMSTLHRFRPSFMVKKNPPMYLRPSEFHHPTILKLQKDFVPVCMKCLNDSTPEVWDSSFSALTARAKMVGMKLLEWPLEKLDDVRKKKLSDMIGSVSDTTLSLGTVPSSSSGAVTSAREVTNTSTIKTSAASMLSGKSPVHVVAVTKKLGPAKSTGAKKTASRPQLNASSAPEIEDVELTRMKSYGKQVYSESEEEEIQDYMVQIFVDVYERNLSEHLDSRLRIGIAIASVLEKRRILIIDYFVSYENRVLDMERSLADLNIGKDATIHVHPRLRGGTRSSILSISFEDSVKELTCEDLVEERYGNNGLIGDPSPVIYPAKFDLRKFVLSVEACRIFQALFRMVYVSHSQGWSLRGRFTAIHIIYLPEIQAYKFEDGYVSRCAVTSTPETFECDINSLVPVLKRVLVAFRKKHPNIYPAYVELLFNKMENFPPNARYSDGFRAWLRNNLAMLSDEARMAQVLITFRYIKYENGIPYTMDLIKFNRWNSAIDPKSYMHSVFQNGKFVTHSEYSWFNYVRHLTEHVKDYFADIFSHTDLHTTIILFWDDRLSEFLLNLSMNFWGKSVDVSKIFCFVQLEKFYPFQWHQRLKIKTNPIVFFDIRIASRSYKLEIELFVDLTPRICNRFLRLCTTGSCMAKPPGYAWSKFFVVMKNEYILGGDLKTNNGDYELGEFLYDENFIAKHTGRGLLSMRGSFNRNGSQFRIMLAADSERDNFNVVFGRVCDESMPTLSIIENVDVNRMYEPREDMVITRCGIMRHI